jgi:hypothetical protein
VRTKGGVNLSRKGRPVSSNPKDTRLFVRLPKEDDKFLEKYAEENGTTKSEVVRKMIERLRKGQK